MNYKTQKRLLYIASFLIPAVLLLAALAYVDAVPFGNNSLLLRDADIQYIDFFSYLRSIFSGENDLLYSFSKNLGGEMVSLLSYYLASPFNILFAFASDEGLPLMFTIVMVLKLSVCGLTFFHASTKLYGLKPVHLAFSTAYALMAYNVLYCWSVMWLDGVLILPLLGLGLYALWQGRAPWTYCATLAYALFTNFYIGYMLCIASVLFSLVHMVLLDGPWKKKASSFGRFLGASCIGGFAAAVMWLPAFLALMEGRAKFDGNAAGILLNFNILGLAGKLVAGASSYVQLSVGTPHIFCGTLVLFLVIVFFLNGKIATRKRLAALAVLLVFLVSFLFRSINIVWHGFSPNYAFNFRYAFIFNYVMIMLAQYALTRIAEVNRRTMVLTGGLILMLILGLLAIRMVIHLDFLTTAGCMTSLAALIVVFGVLFFAENSRLAVSTVLILVTVLEMGINCGLSWNAVVTVPWMDMTQPEQYNAFHQRLTPAVDYVKSTDTGFYRMEKTFLRDLNDSMYYDYHGVSHFSSSQQKFVLRFLEKMGLRNNEDIWAYYNTGSTSEVDSLLGIKYVLSEYDLSQSKGYAPVHTVNGIGVYQNSNALPMVFLSEPEVLTLSMENPDYFDLHNEIWQAISPEEDTILQKAKVRGVILENLEYYTLEGGYTRYFPLDEDRPAFIRYEIEIDRESPLYFYFTSNEAQDANIHINGVDNGAYFHTYRWDMTNAGTYDMGDTVTIDIELLSDQIVVGEALFYYEDCDALSRHTQAILKNPVTLNPESSSHLSGSFTAKEGQLLLFTMPYDSGWQLYIDGQQTAYTMVMDAFMAAPVEAGHHTFELRFVPRGAWIGCAMTLTALAASTFWYSYDKRKGLHDGKKA